MSNIKDENNFTHAGINLIAKRSEPVCNGCFFNEPGRDGSCLFLDIPPCTAKSRKDKRYVIFVQETENDKQG